MFVATIVILLAVASWLFLMAYIMDVKNWQSVVFFKTLPFVLGLASLFLLLVHLGWLTIA